MKPLLTLLLLSFAHPLPGQVSIIGQTTNNGVEPGNQNFVQLLPVKTGTTGTGYVVHSCSVFIGIPGQSGEQVECGVYTNNNSNGPGSVLCHGTYTERGTEKPGYYKVPLSGCGVLSKGTIYWLFVNTNADRQGSQSLGFFDCEDTCSGPIAEATAPDVYYPGKFQTYQNNPAVTEDKARIAVYATVEAQ